MITKILVLLTLVCYIFAAFSAYMGNTAGVIFMLFNATQALILSIVSWRMKW